VATRIMAIGVLVGALVIPAHGQIVVTDPGNLTQAILIAERTLREYDTLWAQYQTILRMSQQLGHMDRFRTPPVAFTRHDPARWVYGAPWLEALNSGDNRGVLYRQVTRPLDRPGAVLDQLPVPARKAIEDEYATIEITDAIAAIAAHQVALTRGYSGSLQQAVQELENDVTHPRSSYHELTAILDKVAAGEVLARRQDLATNQLLSHALEQLLARSKRLRDAEAAIMNMRLGGLLYGRAAGASLVRGAADDLRSWRQP
jgi:hypothetical protein